MSPEGSISRARYSLFVDCEAIEQAFSAAAAEPLLRAVARVVRRVPRRRRGMVDGADTVVVTDHGGAVGGVLRPVSARHVLKIPAAERGAVGPRAGEDVVLGWLLGAVVDPLAVLVQRGRRGDVVAASVQVVDARRDAYAFCVMPRTGADPVPGVHHGRIVESFTLRAQVGVPGAIACARGGRQLLAALVGALESAEVRAAAGSAAGDEEGHRRGEGQRPGASP